MHVSCFFEGEKKKKKTRSRQHLLHIFPGFLFYFFVWLWVLAPLQRPVQWTMAAVIAHVMIQWQESAAAVPLDSLYSRTARPAKVRASPAAVPGGVQPAHVQLSPDLTRGSWRCQAPWIHRYCHQEFILLPPSTSAFQFDFHFIDNIAIVSHPQVLVTICYLHSVSCILVSTNFMLCQQNNLFFSTSAPSYSSPSAGSSSSTQATCSL